MQVAPSNQTSWSSIWSSMWHRLKNLFFSLNTYKTLSPDLKVRQRINRALNDRPALSFEQWFATFYQSQGIVHAVALFAYQSLGQYSGLDMSRLQPTDRLDADLCWTAVCWFDWEAQLCRDVYQQFGVDITECLHSVYPSTIGELVLFLDQAIKNALSEPLHLVEHGCMDEG